MSKTTKIIAALGVVAGLGVAALPAFTFAAETVTGDVDLYVEVQPAIAMTIEGNNDDGGHVSFDSYQYTIVTPQQGDNPQEEGWYEKNGNVYSLTTDTSVAEGKNYFTRSANTDGVDVFSPTTLGGTGAVDGHPEAFLAGPSSSWTQMLPNSVVNGNDTNGFKSTIHVYTNAAGGYNLNVKDADSTTALTKVGSTETIPAGVPESGDTTFDLEAGSAAWGYVVDTASTTGEGYSPISASDTLIKQQSAPTSSEANRKTTVYYGVATASDQATGTYKDVITYTATTR